MFKFYLETATYYLFDDDANKLRLTVDYWNNKVGMENVVVINSRIKELKTKAEAIGKNLLERKHRINFAYKYENL